MTSRQAPERQDKKTRLPRTCEIDRRSMDEDGGRLKEAFDEWDLFFFYELPEWHLTPTADKQAPPVVDRRELSKSHQ